MASKRGGAGEFDEGFRSLDEIISTNPTNRTPAQKQQNLNQSASKSFSNLESQPFSFPERTQPSNFGTDLFGISINQEQNRNNPTPEQNPRKLYSRRAFSKKLTFALLSGTAVTLDATVNNFNILKWIANKASLGNLFKEGQANDLQKRELYGSEIDMYGRNVRFYFDKAPAIDKATFKMALAAEDCRFKTIDRDADVLYDLFVKERIEPAAALGMAIEESSCLNAGAAKDTSNWGNIRYVDPQNYEKNGWGKPPVDYERYQTEKNGSFMKFANPIDGAKMTIWLMNQYRDKLGKVYIFDYIKSWAPDTDGNNPPEYVATIVKTMKRYGVFKEPDTKRSWKFANGETKVDKRVADQNGQRVETNSLYGFKYIPVEEYVQGQPLSCELASLATIVSSTSILMRDGIVISYNKNEGPARGTENAIIAYMNRTGLMHTSPPQVSADGKKITKWGNPYKKFIGRINGTGTRSSWKAGSYNLTEGYGVYADVVGKVANEMFQVEAKVLRKDNPSTSDGVSMLEQLKSSIDAGSPAIVWMPLEYSTPAKEESAGYNDNLYNQLKAAKDSGQFSWDTDDGQRVNFIPDEHAVVFNGYNPDTKQVLLMDVYKGKRYMINESDFVKYWGLLDNQAVIVKKAA